MSSRPEYKIALLSSVGNFLLVPVLHEIQKQGLDSVAVIFDGMLSERLRELSEVRYDKALLPPQLYDFDAGHIPFYFVKNHNSDSAIALYKELGVQYAANAGTPAILKAKALSALRGVVSCHPGKLPDYRGCTAVEWSIYNGHPIEATVHFMNEKIDEGPIIMSEKLPVKRFESYQLIRTRMLLLQARLLVTGLKKVLEENVLPADLQPQIPGGKYYKPIPFDHMQVVREKLERGEFEWSD